MFKFDTIDIPTQPKATDKASTCLPGIHGCKDLLKPKMQMHARDQLKSNIL